MSSEPKSMKRTLSTLQKTLQFLTTVPHQGQPLLGFIPQTGSPVVMLSASRTGYSSYCQRFVRIIVCWCRRFVLRALCSFGVNTLLKLFTLPTAGGYLGSFQFRTERCQYIYCGTYLLLNRHSRNGTVRSQVLHLFRFRR